MVSIYEMKPRFQALLRPAMRSLASAGVTPNALTLAALLGSIAVGVGVAFAGRQPLLFLLLPAWLLARMALNALDGMMARELSMKTRLGAVLNEVGDVVSDVALYLPLGIAYPRCLWPAIAFSLGAMLTEFSGVLALALAIGSPRRYDGPMGKSDRAFLVGVLGLAAAFSAEVLRFFPVVLSLAAILAAWTCWNRLRAALAEAR